MSKTLLTRKDYQSDVDVRWCPGCGDYAILATLQRAFAELGLVRENTVFVSGIGCAARLPYYMNTYGLHTIHGRAFTIASGLKISRPELSVWVISGDGDSLSIGSNHLMHLLRRNLDINILVFNNEIYGLTKGQYSPSSPVGTRAKSTPFGSIDQPVNPAAFALGSGATFFARALDTDAKGMMDVLERAYRHKGTSLVEIYQNCVVFNDGAFSYVNEKSRSAQTQLRLKSGEPLLFDGGKKQVVFDSHRLGVCTQEVSNELREGFFPLVHDERNKQLAQLYARMHHPEFPVPLGVLYEEDRPVFEDQLHIQQLELKKKRYLSLKDILLTKDAYEVSHSP